MKALCYYKWTLYKSNSSYERNPVINKLLMIRTAVRGPDGRGGSRGSQKPEEQHHAGDNIGTGESESAVCVLLFIISDFVVRGANCTGKAAAGLLFGRDVWSDCTATPPPRWRITEKRIRQKSELIHPVQEDRVLLQIMNKNGVKNAHRTVASQKNPLGKNKKELHKSIYIFLIKHLILARSPFSTKLR